MRAIGIDVHRDFCEVAISEGGRLRSAGRVASTPRDLALLGGSLQDDDVVALETTGVGLISAATFVAVIGDIGRFRSARKLVGHLGLDPRVRQSGSSPARMGHISKEGPSVARQALCEAAHAALRTPGPLRAFGMRVAARRGRQVAIVAVASKLATIAWRLLTSGEDYAYANPAQVRLKWRRIELAAGEPSQKGRRTGVSLASHQERKSRAVIDPRRFSPRTMSDLAAMLFALILPRASSEGALTPSAAP